MELRDYLRIVRRSWLLITTILLLGLGAGAAVTVLSTPQYASTTRLFVSTPLTGSDINPYQGSQFSSNRMASYASLIKGTTIAEKVIDKLDLSETPEDLRDQIDATSPTNTVILEITVTDPSPARAQLLSQTTAEVFSDSIPSLEGETPEGQAPIKATISDDAPLPTTAVSPKPKLNLALGALVGLFLGFGIAVLREVLDTTVKTTDLLEELAEAPTLATIGYDPLAPKRPLVSQLEPTSERVEAFRVLRTNLQFVDVDKDSRVFTITSPVPGEGKSTTSANLAISLAESGVRVLLLETDLRRGKTAEYLSLEPAVGLTTVLIGRATFDDVIQPWGSHGLEVITAGPIPPNPAELLQSKAMKAVLDEARARYDVVLVDAAPLLPVADAALVATQTDGAIMLTRFGKTTRDQVTASRGRLEAVDARLLATVLNCVPSKKRSAYGYGYGYGYGYAPETAPTGRKARKAAKAASKGAGTGGSAAGVAAGAAASAAGTAASRSDRRLRRSNRVEGGSAGAGRRGSGADRSETRRGHRRSSGEAGPTTGETPSASSGAGAGHGAGQQAGVGQPGSSQPGGGQPGVGQPGVGQQPEATRAARGMSGAPEAAAARSEWPTSDRVGTTGPDGAGSAAPDRSAAVRPTQTPSYLRNSMPTTAPSRPRQAEPRTASYQPGGQPASGPTPQAPNGRTWTPPPPGTPWRSADLPDGSTTPGHGAGAATERADQSPPAPYREQQVRPAEDLSPRYSDR